MSVYPRNKTGEVFGLLLLAATVFLYLALFSYNALDPSLNVAAPHAEHQNLVGKVGAWTSDFLFQLMGLGALLLPVPLLLVGAKKLRGRSVEYPYIKAAGFLAILISSSLLISLLAPPLPAWANFTAGGIVGILLANLAQAYLNWTGSLVLALTCLGIALLVTTRFSLDRLLTRLSAALPHPSLDFRKRWHLWRERRRERRQLAEMKNESRAVVTQKMPSKIDFETAASDTPAREASPASPSATHSDEAPDEWDERPPPVMQKTSPSTSGHEWTDQRVVRPSGDQVYELPSLDALQDPPDELDVQEEELVNRARKLAMKCAEFDVNGRVLQIHPGPVVTTFEFKPDAGVKYSRITNLSDDLCLALKAESVRIDRVPGKNTVGIEVPNLERRVIFLKELLASSDFQRASSPLTLGLGQRINGAPFVTDLAKMPHLLIAGSTGSGKSVGLNCMVCSILYKASPEQVQFIMVDPKRLELGLYEDIPHLLTPIVTDPKQAANALAWAVREMEERYKVLAQFGVRNIAQFNKLVDENDERFEELEEEVERLPFIVIIVDELADLMMTAGKDVETAVTRLAQMARAVGIHLILATQRPSVDVITGLIKANFPSRISFRVSSKIDSRTILDANGAEQLLGMGDMLFLSPDTARLVRVHGAYISEKEISRIVRFLKDQAEPDYHEEILEGEQDDGEAGLIDVADMEDKLYDEAARFVVESGKASTSLLQRRFRIGYGRAARLLDMMEHEGIVGPPEGSKPRDVLVSSDYFQEVDHSD